MCRTLAEAGRNVVLVAPHDGDTTIAGVQVRALRKPRSRLERMTRLQADALRAALAERAAVYHFHDPELIPIGLVLKLLGKRVVYDVHEDLARQIRSKYWIPASIRRMVAGAARALEHLGAACFDAVVAATPPIAALFPARKTTTVQNFPLLSEFAAVAPTPYEERPLIATYVGAVSRVRGVVEMIQAAELLAERGPVRLTIAGAWQPPELEATLRSDHSMSGVEVLPFVTRPELARLLGRSRVGLVVLHPLSNYLDAQPVKLFEYMAAGIPVVASDFPLWRTIVREAGCGLLVDPLDPKAIADAVWWLISHPLEAAEMGRRGRAAVHESCHWEAEARKLLDVYRRIAA
jgi:glycosyltransferase involved in cell wall biosynthesis